MQVPFLRHQIKIQQRSGAQDTLGQPVLTWSDVCTTRAQILPLSGRELELAQAINAEIKHQVTIRYRPGITAAMRVVYQGRNFNIEAPPIDVEMRHVLLQLMCSEGLNNG